MYFSSVFLVLDVIGMYVVCTYVVYVLLVFNICVFRVLWLTNVHLERHLVLGGAMLMKMRKTSPRKIDFVAGT